MANDRIVYIPWNQADAAAFAHGYNTHPTVLPGTHHKRDWTYVFLDGPAGIIDALGFGTGKRLHLSGHGAMGDPNVYPPHGSTAAPVSYQTVVAQLVALGLKKYYAGTIVCDVCYSSLGVVPFAKLLARELWTHGYKAACVMGFAGSLQEGYVSAADGGVAGKYRHRTVTKADGSVVKSKEAKERFWGFT